MKERQKCFIFCPGTQIHAILNQPVCCCIKSREIKLLFAQNPVFSRFLGVFERFQLNDTHLGLVGFYLHFSVT